MPKKGKQRNGPKVGAKGPDFALKDQDGSEVRLADLRGKRVLLSFHPLAFTSVCTKQMKALERGMDRFERLGVVPLGLSVDAWPSKHAWAKDMGVRRLRILADFHPKGAVAKRVGVYLDDKGISGRANVLLDGSGRVVWFRLYDIPELPDIKEVFAAIRRSAGQEGGE
jgi:peroxiredoxin